ncbi:MAG: hypothetical protein DMF78_12430 [Acidobacteria bacterium]|nr:MAG: hypothetical protein DMF78_12430 [Acidobacteriota bacterium]
MAIEPTASEASWSVRGTQVGFALVAFVLFHTPPCAPPAYAMSGLVGWTAMALRRPLTGESCPAVASVWPSGMVIGPSGFHMGPPPPGAPRRSLFLPRA